MNKHVSSSTLGAELKAHTGRFTDKVFDWNAFPSNAGFDELSRAQMRYVGQGARPRLVIPPRSRPIISLSR